MKIVIKPKTVTPPPGVKTVITHGGSEPGHPAGEVELILDDNLTQIEVDAIKTIYGVSK